MAIHRNTHVQEMHDIQITPLSTQPIHSHTFDLLTDGPMDDRPTVSILLPHDWYVYTYSREGHGHNTIDIKEFPLYST